MYKLIGFRPNHDEMIEFVKNRMWFYVLVENPLNKEDKFIRQIRPIGLTIGENKKWQFEFADDVIFADNEPIFISLKALKRYFKARNIKV